MADYKILIQLVNNTHAVPITVMSIGKTVEFTCNDGDLRIEIPGNWPFKEPKPQQLVATQPQPVGTKQLVSTQPLTLNTPGQFEFRCFIKPTDGPNAGKEVGWNPTSSPQSGGNGVAQ